jgi:hypothetical protein|tara:strand:+ start:3225 stop:3446 length:222 start_codon:yes stop_codon:yes gene_type:complete
MSQQEQKEQQEQKVTTFPQAMQMLVDGVNVAQKRGAYSLEESALLFQAMTFLRTNLKQQQPEQKQPLEKIEEM